MYLNHFATHLKSVLHCKSTILQLNLKKRKVMFNLTPKREIKLSPKH